MTLLDASQLGYREVGVSWQRGYVSRRASDNPKDIKVFPAGGCRLGLLYYVKPSWRSTQYCLRVYLKKR